MFLRHIQALAVNIDTFITDFDISSKQNYTQLSAPIKKCKSKIKHAENIDSKILIRSPLKEKEKELSEIFTANLTSENEYRKTKLQFKLPKLELQPFDRSALNWQSF